MTHSSTVCILMGTYNGQAFLAEQLLSIENQSHKDWRLVISDDGSTDDTLAIAKTFQEKLGKDRIEIRLGPKQGFCKNFLNLACDSTIKADFYAFADQDDIWMVDKLSIALAYFNAANHTELPRAYCGRTQLVDENSKLLGRSPLFSLPLSFRNALVQSIAGGNTMVFNQMAKKLLEKSGLQQVVSHDWWVYLLVKGAGGSVYYDPEPTILYRQHDGALVGSNNGFRAKIDRVSYVFSGRFKTWNTINYQALVNIKHLLSKDNQDILTTFGVFRGARLKDRIRLLEVCGLYRQTWPGTFSLWLATIINKI
jgi:glycosyltransferase involved in cell wall biosynthesis